ncbi:HET domain containing protein [Hyaloscypha variabilis]
MYWEICLRQGKIESDILAFFMNIDGDGPSVGISPENTSREALPLVKQWLFNCCMTHGRCSTIEKMFLPTRLIFIRDSLPRLMQAIEIKGCPKCATLSHCWGKLKSLVLRQDNVETFATRIPQEALPQSFKDAIEVARSLDIDYLWIDSLCIIQNNDSDDWAKEAAQMSSIYGGSYLNIAATSAVDGSKGFLGNWHCFNSGFRAKISTIHGDTSCICVPRNLYRDSISSSPLAQRGWVVQERLLAPRTVHFTSRQVFWECNSCVSCEAFHSHLPDVFERSEGYLRKKPLLEYSWKEIVQQYSRGSLTRSRDKIVAISGLSRAAQHTQRFGYLAGLWRSSLIFQLCWHRTSDIAPPPVEYRGPSWSWISVDSGVTLVSGPRDSDVTKSTTLYAQVVDAHVGLTGADPFGEISSANLYLNCRILYPINSSTELPDSSGFVYMTAWGIYIRADINFDSSARDVKRPLYLLPIMSRVVDILDYSTRSMINGQVEGLLLELAESSPGHFILECDRYTKSDQHLFFAAMLEANPLSPSHYSEIQQEADGTIKHLITLT